MVRINLLPWREELRRQRRQEFTALLALALLLGVGIWFGGHSYYGTLIERQQARNDLLQSELNKLERQIAEIRQLEATKADLIARMRVIEALQQGRPLSVRLFQQIAATAPQGVRLTGLRQLNGSLSITGIAESNAHVSDHMSRLEASPWLGEPQLDVIQLRQIGGRAANEYSLRVRQLVPGGDAP